MTAKKKSIAEDLVKAITPRMIIISVLSASGAMLAMLLAVYAGMKVGLVDAYGNSTTTEGAKNIAVINISYNSQAYHFASSESCLGGDTAQCLMGKYAADSKSYAIIKSSDQLKRFMDITNAYGGQEYTANVPEDFFYSGSIIALTKESKDYEDFAVTNVYRDENYNLHIKAKTAKSATPEANNTSAHVVLLSVPNIQPKEIYLDVE